MAVSAYSSTNASERAISQFRSELDGGGLRPNLYEVHLDFPDGVAPNLAQAKRMESSSVKLLLFQQLTWD